MQKCVVVLALVLSCAGMGYTDLTSDLTQWGIDFGLRLVQSPASLFMEFQNTMDDTVPVKENKWVVVKTNLVPLMLPFTATGIAINAKVWPESQYIPQCGLYFNYWALPVLSAVPADTASASISGYGYGAVIAKKLKKQTRLFTGIKASQAQMSVKLAKPVDMSGTQFTGLDMIDTDYYWYTGLEFQSNAKKSIYTQLGYSFNTKRIFSKISLCYTWSEIGLAIYPEGFIVVYPYWNIRIKF
ncbi:MAG: hypothetical protein WC955_10060 [Elusimicrobiota bacterium]